MRIILSQFSYNQALKGFANNYFHSEYNLTFYPKILFLSKYFLNILFKDLLYF